MAATAAREQTGRRWSLSEDERALIADARRGEYGIREVVQGLIAKPRLIPDAFRSLVRGAKLGLRGNADLLNYLSQRRVARVVPDAATGAAWWGEELFVAELLPRLDADTTALELGAGAGRVSRHVAPHVASLVVTDVSSIMVAEARENLAAFPNICCEQTHGFTLGGFEDAEFDLVYAHDVFPLFDGNEALALIDECRRVLREDGRLVISTYTMDSPLWAASQLSIARRLARAGHTSVLQLRPWTIRQLECMCELAGFEIESCVRGDDPEITEEFGEDAASRARWQRLLNDAAHCIVFARAA